VWCIVYGLSLSLRELLDVLFLLFPPRSLLFVIVARYPVNLVVAMFVAKLAFHVARIGSDVWQQQLLLARTTVGCWLQPFKSVPLFLTLLATCVCFKIVERDALEP
jgi:hypothetical protein